MAESPRRGTGSALLIPLLVGLVVDGYGLFLAFALSVGSNEVGAYVRGWGLFFLVLLVAGPILSAVTWARRRSRLGVVAGMLLACLPFAVFGVASARVHPDYWLQVVLVLGFIGGATALLLWQITR